MIEINNRLYNDDLQKSDVRIMFYVYYMSF